MQTQTRSLESCALVNRLWVLKVGSESCSSFEGAIELDFGIQLVNSNSLIIPEPVPAQMIYRKHAIIVGRNPVPRRVIITDLAFVGNYTKILFKDSNRG